MMNNIDVMSVNTIRALAAEQEGRINTLEGESQKKDAEIERLSKRGIFRRLFGL